MGAVLAEGGLPAIEAVLTNVRLAVHRGLDPNPNNLVAGSTLTLEAKEVILMVRIESDVHDRAQFRLTIASSDTCAMNSIKTVLLNQLS